MLENMAYLAIPWPSPTVHSSSRVCCTEILSQRYHVLIRGSWDNCHSGRPPTDSTVKMDAPSHIVNVTCSESHGILFSMYGSENSAGPKHQSCHFSAMWLELGWAGCDIFRRQPTTPQCGESYQISRIRTTKLGVQILPLVFTKWVEPLQSLALMIAMIW